MPSRKVRSLYFGCSAVRRSCARLCRVFVPHSLAGGACEAHLAAMNPPSDERCAQAEAFLRGSVENNRFDARALAGLTAICAQPGRVSCALEVTEGLSNRYETLHGGCIATIVDVVTTAALVTRSEFGGVTLELNCSYLNAAKVGEWVEVEARVLKVGGAVAVLACTLTARGSGRVVAEGRHTKYLPRTEIAPHLARMTPKL